MQARLPLLVLCTVVGMWSPVHSQVVTLGNYGGANTHVLAGTYVHTGHFSNTGPGSMFTNYGELYVRNNLHQSSSAIYVTGGGSWLWLQGTALQDISGDVPLNIGTIRVDNAAGVRLTQDLVVPGTLQLMNGDLNLNDFNINLVTTGTLVEDRLNNHLVLDNTPLLSESNQGGYVRATMRATTGTLAEVAGMGIFLTNSGTVAIDRYHYAGAMGATTIKKNYDVTGSPVNATMRIEYASDEAVTVSVNNTLKLFRFNGTVWVEMGGAWVDLPVDYVEHVGIASFSPWSVANGGFLPVTLLEFQANRLTAEEVMLEWTTANESNNLGFEVEKSFNANQFEVVGFVPGAVNAGTIQSYQFPHVESGGAFYRLRQMDQNGESEYSPVRFVQGIDQSSQLLLYPNPAHDLVHLSILNTPTDETCLMQVMQADGKQVADFAGNVVGLEGDLNGLIRSLSRGLYLLRVTSKTSVFVKHLTLY